MPVTVEQYQDEPIIMASFSGLLDFDTVREMFAISADLIDAIGPPVYRITDWRGISSTFSDMMQIFREAGQGFPGSSTDPRLHPVMVGRTEWSRLTRDAMLQEQFGGIDIPIFETVEEALEYVYISMSS